MEFTVQLRYESGSQTVLSIDAESADEALAEVRDRNRVLVGIHITGPGQNGATSDRRSDAGHAAASTFRRVPVQHRRSRRQG